MYRDFSGIPRGHYAAVVADPPWHFKARTALQVANWNSRRDVEKHYETMSLADIEAMPVREIVAKDAHLFLWITGPMLVIGAHLPIMKAWGFKPSSVAFNWTKLKRSYDARQLRIVATAESDLHVGLGLTTRKNAEYCLLGRRGNARRLSRKVREAMLSPVREHSRKPDETYPRVEKYCAGPYIDLFSRREREGWDQFGNEVGKFNESEEDAA